MAQTMSVYMQVFFAFVVMICLLWTLLLITLNLAPNHTVNLVMRTETFDDGSFWLFVVPSPSVLMLAVCGLSAVALGYVVVLAKMIIRPIQVAPELATKIPVNSSSEMLLSSTKLGPSRLKTKGVSRHGAMEFVRNKSSLIRKDRHQVSTACGTSKCKIWICAMYLFVYDRRCC